MNWSSADIEAFLSLMGDAATLDDGSLNGTAITGVFLREFSSVNQFDGSVESNEPLIDCATSDVSNVEHNQALRVNDTDYLIVGIENQGNGWTRLILRERFD